MISPCSQELYRIIAEWKPARGEDDVWIRIRFDAGWSQMCGRLSGSVAGTVWERALLVPENRCVLIGVPSERQGRSGPIYFLALSVIRD